MYHISLNRMCALYFFHIVCIIQGHLVFSACEMSKQFHIEHFYFNNELLQYAKGIVSKTSLSRLQTLSSRQLRQEIAMDILSG